MRNLVLLTFWVGLCLCATAQTNPYPATPAKQRLEAYQQRRVLQAKGLANGIPAKNIGPTVMSGRVVDIAVNPSAPHEFYVAYATGGLWLTRDNGISFRSLIDTTAAYTLGAVAVNWQTGHIWIGTGEVNSSRSSYAGVGLYTSADTGKTWTYRGLPESHHIGRIVLHPTDPNTAWVAALGHLYSNNRERGVYKTTDGGRTWAQTLYVDETTGAVDMALHPSDPNVLWASTWTRSRRAWDFVESGEGSAIWRSDDGGNTWQQQSTPKSGFPTGELVGRIGLSVFDGNTLYAVVDNQETYGGTEDKSLITADKLRTISQQDFLALPADSLNKWLEDNNFPDKYTAKTVFAGVKEGTYKPADLARYLGDANDRLINATVKGAEVYRSNDGGKTWQKTHDVPLERVYNTYGYYFGMVHVAPYDQNRVFTYGVPIIMSDDGGKTWESIGGESVHADHHMLWINPKLPGHLIVGNDGGINITYDYGKHWQKCNTPPVGQFYAIQVDNAKPYNVYGGLQDNGTWKGPSNYEAGTGWHASGKYPYAFISGGDGMQVMVDPCDGTTYTGYQFGNYFRTEPSGKRTYLHPRHELGEDPLRFNWQTPIWLSKHNPDILYLGANKVYRSLDRGDSWQCISPDLTTNPAQGDVPYGTLACLTESPHAFGVLYAGSDDGRVHITKDGGVEWTDISAGLPSDLWVSRIEVSPHDAATVFVSLNGYRWDHMDAYLYKSIDYGRTWQRIGANLPAEPINVVRQDLENEQILYVGSDNGLYISLDGGQTFMGYLPEGYPEVPVHDLVVHPTEPDLVVGTHGRSIFTVDLTYIRQLTPEVVTKPLTAFAPNPMRYSERWGRSYAAWTEADAHTFTLTIYCKEAGKLAVSLNSRTIPETEMTVQPGLNQVEVPLALAKFLDLEERSGEESPYLQPGEYVFSVTVGKAQTDFKLTVEEPRKRKLRGAPRPDGP